MPSPVSDKLALEADEFFDKKAALETRQADNRQKITDLEEQMRQLNAHAAEFSGAATDRSVPGAPNRWAWAMEYPPLAENPHAELVLRQLEEAELNKQRTSRAAAAEAQGTEDVPMIPKKPHTEDVPLSPLARQNPRMGASPRSPCMDGSAMADDEPPAAQQYAYPDEIWAAAT